MKRILFSCLVAVNTIVSSADTLTIRQLFVEMPDTVLPYISRNNRLDCLDFIDSNMKAEVTNMFGGKSQMTAVTDDSITILLSEACRVDIFLLSMSQTIDSSSKVIAILHTIGLENEHQETEVDYYTVRWNRLADGSLLIPEDKKRVMMSMKKINIIKLLQNKINKE